MDLSRRAPAALPLVLAIASTLALIAFFSPSPWYGTERDIYERLGRQFFLPDCSSLQCTRVLVSWVLERLPGPSLLRWKIYAVAGGTIAAAGAAHLAFQFGLSARAAVWSAWLVALGSGVQITLFDPYGSDPFVYAIAPWLFWWVVQRRIALATAVAAVGVFAKEFAAAPLWVGVGYALLGKRRDLFWRCAAGAMTATAVWVVLQIAFILRFNYSYAGSESARVFEGANFTRWFRLLGPVQSAGALALHVLPLVALAAAAYRRAPRQLKQLVVASIPAALALVYVQQPDRALWNFQSLLAPMAALSLELASPAFMWVFLAGYVSGNLRVTPQVAHVLSPAALAVCVVGGFGVIASSVSAARDAEGARDPRVSPESGERPDVRVSSRAKATAAASAIALALSLLVAADIFVHRRDESEGGVNVWGYRGPVVLQKAPDEIRVLVLGGSVAFGRELTGSMPAYLHDYLNNVRLRADASFRPSGPISVINLATPYDHVAAFEHTLEDYAWLRDDVVCLYLGPDDPAPSAAAARSGWRRQSAIFRSFGYLPVLPSLVTRPPAVVTVADDPPGYVSDLEKAIARASENGRRVLVATHPFLTADEGKRQDLVASQLRARFDRTSAGSYVDLRESVARNDPTLVADGIHPTPRGNSVIAESLSQSIFRLLHDDRSNHALPPAQQP